MKQSDFAGSGQHIKQSVIQVDAFTDRLFAGNPAAVCVSQAPLEESLMQRIATEMNLSETAFLYPLAAAGNYSLRCFTPTAEIDLCGHATLASAHVLWTEGHLAADITARFQTKSGELSVAQQGELLRMDFPSQPVQAASVSPALVGAMNHADIVHCSRNQVNILVELRSHKAVANLTPDFDKFKKLNCQGVIVTSIGDAPLRFCLSLFCSLHGDSRRSGHRVFPLFLGPLLASQAGQRQNGCLPSLNPWRGDLCGLYS